MWKALPWDHKCVPCLESCAPLSLFREEIRFLFISVYWRKAAKALRVQIFCGTQSWAAGSCCTPVWSPHHNREKISRASCCLQSPSHFEKLIFDSSCLPWERVRALSHSQKDQKCFSRKNNIKVTSGETWPAKGRQLVPVQLPAWVEMRKSFSLHSSVHMRGQWSPVLSHPLQGTTNSTVPGKAKLNCKKNPLRGEGNGGFGQIAKPEREDLIRKFFF